MRATTPTNILDEIFNPAVQAASDGDVSQETRGALMWLPVGRIYDNPFQPRQNYDDVESLAESIWALRRELPGTMGLQQPPVARVIVFGADGDAVPVDRSIYSDPMALRRLAISDKHAVELHFGHRRLRAWRLLRDRDPAGYAEFPVLLAFADDLGMWKHVVAENAQRKDISPLEEAESLRTAITRFNLTHAQAAEPFGFARTTVSNKLRLLELPDDIRQRLADGKITERHARALLTLAPAPHLWHAVHFDREMSVAEMEKHVDVLIARCQPLAPQPNTGYKRAREGYYGGEQRYQVQTDKFDPPAWPYDWTPSASDQGGVKIFGACGGCKYRVQFGGDAGARCAQLEVRCFEAKSRRWEVEQRQAQAEAIRRAAPPAAGSAAGSAAGGSVSQETSDKKQLSGDDGVAGSVSQETSASASASAPALNHIDVAVAADRPVESGERPQWFTRENKYLYNSAPAALLEKGLCSAERCACLVVAYNPDAKDHHVRPDAVNAPNMCVGCTSTHRMNNRRKELEVGDLQEHRRRVKAEQEESERLLREAFEGYRADDLWHNRVIVGALVQGETEIEQRYKLKDADMATLQWTIFEGCARCACRTWDGSTQKWNLEKVRAWLHQVATGAGRVEPEIGMVVEAPALSRGAGSGDEDAESWRHWEGDWADDDEAAYQDLILDWDGRAWQSLAAKVTKLVYEDPLGITPAVLLRLAMECPDVTLSGHFGRMAREWQAVAA
jgi:ParB/RepB/Spo0J family partition protein